ncbi:hypothetical protein [Chlamydia vaughanii]|uniref:hypothetical protein n=1 Tax=Chlamydia vaughanii TaxID=3112552 RepID=UPI0032B15C59
METLHGPIVVGRTLEQGGGDIENTKRSGAELTDEQKEAFNNSCVTTKQDLEKTMITPLQKCLFLVADCAEDLPKTTDREPGVVKRGFENRQRCYNPPTTQTIEPLGASDLIASHYTKKIDFSKLEKQLLHLNVVNLRTGEKHPLGRDNHVVSTVLQNACHFLVSGAVAFDPPLQKYALMMIRKDFLMLILLSLLSCEYAPVGPEGEDPTPMAELRELKNFIRQNAAATAPQDQGAEGGDDPNDEGWFSPKAQEDLLNGVKKTQNIFGLIG